MASLDQELNISNPINGPNILTPKKLTPIQNFYSGKNILITGGTGFLGKLVIEKLLWSCPDIGDLYLIVRDKKGKDLQSRIDDLTSSPAFTRVKRDVPGYRTKLKAMSGDCCLPGLGLTDEDRATLIKEVHVIFHVAATVRFHEPLTFAMTVNVRATVDILNMAKEMKQLKSFVHVSTAFANCYTNQLGEHFYETPVDPIKLLNFVETADSKLVDDITPKLLGKWPNTYTFTKSLAEDYIREYGVGMPIGVFRPSIVISSVEEPVPKWVDNWYGVSGFITACGAGLLRVICALKDGEANVVPVDLCVNGLLASGWDVAERYKEIKNSVVKPSSRDIRIYNFVLADRKITWTQIYDKTSTYAMDTPPSKAIWYRCLVIQSNPTIHQINRLFLHYIPALLSDTICILVGKKPEFIDLYKKVDRMEDVVKFFTMQNWNFQNHNMPKLVDKMTEEDRKLYSCDMRKIDWEEFLKTYFLGVRRYLLKDDDSTIPAAKRKYFKLHILHRVTQLIFFILLLRGSYRMVNRFLPHLK